MRSRYEILLETYSKVINIEALTMVDMVKRDIIPAVTKYLSLLSEEVNAKKAACGMVPCEMEVDLIQTISSLGCTMYKETTALDKALDAAKDYSNDALALPDTTMTLFSPPCNPCAR